MNTTERRCQAQNKIYFLAPFSCAPPFSFFKFSYFFILFSCACHHPLCRLNGAEASMPSPHRPGVDNSQQPWATIKLFWTATLPGLLPLRLFSLE
jgi:hypothetical protein